MSEEPSSPEPRSRSPAASRILRGWGIALAVLLLLGWCASWQPFYRPALAIAAILVLAVTLWWSWRASSRRGDRRRRPTRRRADRRGD
ncbi:MAG TPA: hypothetical protein VEA99_03290 [Gemmatimonadaceae bacterium]|nr:hypothetical protein [Gemmatimonadaceae bacterium]